MRFFQYSDLKRGEKTLKERRQGFTLALVLIIMLIVIFMSAVIMDLTTNYFSTSQATIEHQKLYNAAQSGVEWGKAQLYANRENIYKELQSYDGSLDSIRAKEESGVNPENIDTTVPIALYDSQNLDLTVDIIDCNYEMGGHSYNPHLPPIQHPYEVTDSGGVTLDVPRGFSMIIDPNRVMTFSGMVGLKFHPFIIRSVASTKDGSRDFGIENMVVMIHE